MASFGEGLTRGLLAGAQFKQMRQERELKDYELEQKRALQEAMKSMPNWSDYAEVRAQYKEGMDPGADFQGPPTPEQVEAWIPDADSYTKALQQASNKILDPQKREQFVTIGMQPVFDRAQKLAMNAVRLKQSGQDEAAYKSLQQVYAHIPDGQDVQLLRNPENNQLYGMRIIGRDGSVVQDFAPLLDDNQFMLAATVGLDPKTFFTVVQGEMARKQQADRYKQLNEQWERGQTHKEKIDERQMSLREQEMGIHLGQLLLNAEKFNWEKSTYAKYADEVTKNSKRWDVAALNSAIDFGYKSVKDTIEANPALASNDNAANIAQMARTAMSEILQFNPPGSINPVMASTVALALQDKTGKLAESIGLRVNPNEPTVFSITGPDGRPQVLYSGATLQNMIKASASPAAAPGAPGAPGADETTTPGFGSRGELMQSARQTPAGGMQIELPGQKGIGSRGQLMSQMRQPPSAPAAGLQPPPAGNTVLPAQGAAPAPPPLVQTPPQSPPPGIPAGRVGEADFPKVGASEQAARDNNRLNILMTELADAQKIGDRETVKRLLTELGAMAKQIKLGTR